MNSLLFLELEAVVNAVEPRVWERYNPGLPDEEIDAFMAEASFELPDDLRSLYKWRNGSNEQGASFLGEYISMLPLVREWAYISETRTRFSVADWSHNIREEVREFYQIPNEEPPLDLDSHEFVYLFDDGGDGTYIFASFSPRKSISCDIYQFMPSDWPALTRMFCGVEPMIRTAIEAWRSGIFSPREGRFGWELNSNFRSWAEMGRSLNPNCDYWLDGAAQ